MSSLEWIHLCLAWNRFIYVLHGMDSFMSSLEWNIYVYCEMDSFMYTLMEQTN
jgi:hypothetical protein